jgi:hypothetical protein
LRFEAPKNVAGIARRVDEKPRNNRIIAMNSTYDNFPDAVWAVIRQARITQRDSACKVIQLPGQNL